MTCRQYTEMVELGAQVPHEKKRGMKRVWSAEKDVATGAKMVGMKRVASYAKVPRSPSSSKRPRKRAAVRVRRERSRRVDRLGAASSSRRKRAEKKNA